MKDEGLRVRNTPAFKLKDRPNRQFQAINMMKQFGFLPEVIIVEKVPRMSNTIVVRAVLTLEEVKKENALEVKQKGGKNGKKSSKEKKG